MLLLYIGLVVAAWRRGWRAKALLPLVYGLGAAFFIGFFAAMAGIHSPEPLKPFIALITLGQFIALGLMIKNPRKSTEPLSIASSTASCADVTDFPKAA